MTELMDKIKNAETGVNIKCLYCEYAGNTSEFEYDARTNKYTCPSCRNKGKIKIR